jgi:hypothetical protein
LNSRCTSDTARAGGGIVDVRVHEPVASCELFLFDRVLVHLLLRLVDENLDAEIIDVVAVVEDERLERAQLRQRAQSLVAHARVEQVQMVQRGAMRTLQQRHALVADVPAVEVHALQTKLIRTRAQQTHP